MVRSVLPRLEDPLRALFDVQYAPMVRLATALLGHSSTAEDVVQQAFVAVEPVLPRLESGAEVAYLRKSVVNGCRSQVRHDRARKRQPILVREGEAERPEDRAGRSEQEGRVLAALDRLPFRQRQCLVLRYYAGLTDTEVAGALDLSLGSAKTHLRRGLIALRAELGDLR